MENVQGTPQPQQWREMPLVPKLKPCPACFWDMAALKVEHLPTGGAKYAVMCDACGLRTAYADTWQEAFELWQQRLSDSPSPQKDEGGK